MAGQPPSGSPSGLTGDDITSESYLSQLTFDESDPFAQSILSDEYSTNIGENAFEASINSIDKELTSDREEEAVVPEMNYKFGQYGFKFEETSLGDRMKVTSANDQEITIPLDAYGIPFFEGLEIRAGARANKLKKFLQDNKEASEAAFRAGLKKEEEKLNKIQNEKELMALNTLFNTQVDICRAPAGALQISFGGKTPEELADDPNYNTYLMATQRLDMAEKALRARQKSFMLKGAEFDAMVGDFVQMRQDRGEGGMLFVERLGKSLLGGVGGAFTSVPEEIGALITSIKDAFNPADVSENYDVHVDIAMDALSQNGETKYKLDDTTILGDTFSDELIEIKELLNKGKNLDARDELRLKGILADLGPQNGKVLFENISN